MNQGLWIARKNYLCVLIRQVSDNFGGDDVKFIKQHCSEVLALYPAERIEETIACYEEMARQKK